MIYKSISPQFKIDFFKYIDHADRILITAHLSPDDDAIGSTLGLQYLLQRLYPKKKIDVAFSGYPSDRFSCFEGYQNIKYNHDIADELKNYNLLICLDVNQYSRISSNPDLIKSTNLPKICIDHHGSIPDNFSLTTQDVNATSTAELIYKIAEKKFDLDLIFCESILLGLLGDTGTFNYIKPGQYHIFNIIKKILTVTQINIQEFKSRYMTVDPESFEVIRQLMKNSQFLHQKNWPNFHISYLTREYIADNKYDDSQVGEGSDIFVAQYIRIIKNNNWGFAIRPHSDGSCRLSFRSLPGSVNVRDLAERMGIGGGHDRASGGKIMSANNQPIDPLQALQIVLDWMKLNSPVLV